MSLQIVHAREDSRSASTHVDDAKTVFRYVRADGTAITFGRPFGSMVIAIIGMLILALTGAHSALGARLIQFVLRKWIIP
jgi:hypothetical protein